jgi:hypothetical protein
MPRQLISALTRNAREAQDHEQHLQNVFLITIFSMFFMIAVGVAYATAMSRDGFSSPAHSRAATPTKRTRAIPMGPLGLRAPPSRSDGWLRSVAIDVEGGSSAWKEL